MDYKNMDTHHSPEGHVGQDPIPPKMDHCTQSDIALKESTKSCTQDINKRYISPKKEQILSPKSAECTPLNNTSSSVGVPTTVSCIELFSDRHLVRNIIPNHHIHPFVKLEPLDSESWGNASSDGKRTQNQDHSATHERTEFGLLRMDLRKCDQKKVLFKMDIEGNNIDDNGKTCENDKAESTCDECATITSLDRETNKNCGKCGKIFSSQTNRQPQELYKCDQCGKMFSQFNELQKHLDIHTQKHLDIHTQKHLDIHTQHLHNSQGGKFSLELSNKDDKSRDSQRPASARYCRLCDKTFRTELVFKRHIDSIHTMHPCETCGTKLMGKRLLEYHKLAHEHEKQSRKFICDICGDVYHSEDSFRRHLEIHKDKSKPYVCGICGKSRNTVDRLGKHVRAAHRYNGRYGESNFDCDVCGKSYGDSECLKKHMKYHTKKPLKCEICNQGFTKQYYLDTHYESHSIVTTELSCAQCERTFKSKLALKKHIDYVHKKQPCGVCGKEFSKQELVRHKGEHNTQFQCKVCGKYYSGVKVLKLHMQYHSRNTFAIKKLACKVCNKKFISQESLKTHTRIHNRSSKCSVCGRCFANRSSLWMHMEVHNRSEWVHKCLPCKRTFKTEYLLRKHETNFHVKHTCDICGQSFQGKVWLNYHKRAHQHESSSHNFSCGECGEKYKTFDSFQTHLEIHKDTDRPYRCDICGKTYCELDYLRQHLKNTHTDEDTLTEFKFSCDVCGRKFKQSHHLKNHMNFHTKKYKHLESHCQSNDTSSKHQCEKCDEVFFTKNSLSIHQINVHTMESCNVCGELIPKGKLNSHRATHEEKQKCDLCGKCYSGKSMKRHMQYHARSVLIKKLVCEICGKKFATQTGLQNHSQLHEESIKCNICGRCFSSWNSLKVHMRSHNRSESSMKCEPCDRTFKTEYLLQKHTTNLHMAHSCDICGQSFQGKVWLNYHERAHQHENNSHDFCCGECGEKYKTFDSFQTHLEIHKDADRPYRCDICGKTYCELEHLRKHLKNTHTDEDTLKEFKFSCDVCGRKFKQSYHFKNHMDFHTKNTLFSCDICNRSFIYKSHLDKHLESHCQRNDTSSKHQCEKCDEVFLTKNSLSIHQNDVHTMESCNVCGELIPKGKLNSHRATHEEKQKCDLCGKCYSGKSMKRHMQYHARSVLIKKFVCDLCGKKFSKQASLQNHSQLHEKLIKCNICGRYVSSWYSLKCHIETHNRTESSTKCESCDKTFKTEYFLQRHTTDLHVAHSCDICGQSFQGKVWLNFHERAHQHENNSHDFCCYECGESYKTFDSFQTHLEIHKDMDRPYRCDICGKTFCELRYLRSHLKDKNTHTDEDTLKEFKFSCDVCGRKFQQSLRFEKHMDFHRKNKQISCNICNRNFTNQSALDKHFESHSTLDAEHHCEKCDMVFQTDFILKRHLKLVHTTELCRICGEEVSKGKLNSHKAKHQEKQKCDLCGKYYYGFQGMRRHKQYHKRLLRIKKFSCEICSKQFYLHQGLIEHMKSHQKSIRCKICGRCFSYKGTLRRHMITIHNRPASVGKCETCGRTFQTERVLQRHVKCFHVKKSCEICGLKFKGKPENHMERHHTKHVCDTCGIKIDGKLLLECHNLTHVFEKGLFDFECYVCGESFNTSDKLQRHIDNHIKNENGSSHFGCEICGKRFTSLLSLSTHVNTHRKDIGHYCKICGRGFKEAEEKHKCPSKSIPKHMCEVCGRGFWSEFSLNKHKEEHDGVDLKCEQCDWKFATEKKLQIHMDYVHKLVPCDICGQELTNKEMGSHKRTMHAEDYVCDICGHTFSGLSKLKIHLETHSLSTQDTKYLNCNICGKNLNTVVGLQRHKAIVHKCAKKNKSLICEICGKGFSERNGLLNHTLTHKPKSLQCNKCGKKFVTRSGLLNHVKCKRECQTCGKMFNDTRLFEQHIQLHDGADELHGDVTSQTHSDRKPKQ